MIKKVQTKKLKPGMFVSDFDCGWIENPFFSSTLKITKEAEVEKIVDAGIHTVYIDTDQGDDMKDSIAEEEAEKKIEEDFMKIDMSEPLVRKSVAVKEEAHKAKKIQKEAMKIVNSFMEDSKVGKPVDVEKVDEVVEDMVDSIFRNKDALEILGKVRDADKYTFQHSVNVCVLMVSFAKSIGLKRAVINDIGKGALLHDIGKMHVPGAVLNKPGKLTDAEFDIMRSHVVHSARILKDTPGIPQIALAVASQHHERFDGTGYPNKLKGDQISPYGQMASIVDVYDALTANRVYHKGMVSADGLKKLFEWSKFHFNADYVQKFIRSIGIYPTGSLVKLKSGRLAVILEQGESDLTKPVIKIIYDSKKERFVEALTVRMDYPPAKFGDDAIAGPEPADKLGIDPYQYLDIDLHGR